MSARAARISVEEFATKYIGKGGFVGDLSLLALRFGVTQKRIRNVSTILFLAVEDHCGDQYQGSQGYWCLSVLYPPSCLIVPILFLEHIDYCVLSLILFLLWLVALHRPRLRLSMALRQHKERQRRYPLWGDRAVSSVYSTIHLSYISCFPYLIHRRHV